METAVPAVMNIAMLRQKDASQARDTATVFQTVRLTAHATQAYIRVI